MTEGTAKFFLLQVNDALFPIGGYSHSYGLETYIQKGIVHDEDSAQEFIHKRLKYNFSYNEFMAVRLAFEYALREDLEAISRLGDKRGKQKTGIQIYQDPVGTGASCTEQYF